MQDKINIYYIFDKVAGVKWNTFMNSSDEAAIRMIKNDIYHLVQEPVKNSAILSRIADSCIFKIEITDNSIAKVVNVSDLKNLVPFDIEIELKKTEPKKVEISDVKKS